jgi:hypothetical protein
MIGLNLIITETPKHGVRVKVTDGIRNTQTPREVEVEKLIMDAIYEVEGGQLALREEFLKSVWFQAVEELVSESAIKFGWLEDVGAACAHATNHGEDVIVAGAPLTLAHQTQTLYWPTACKKIKQVVERIAGNDVAILWEFFGEGGESK